MEYKSAIPVPDAKSQLHALDSKRDNVVLYGTGNYGALALHALKARGITPLCICDSNQNNWGKEFYGHKVISPLELKKSHASALVIVASLQFRFLDGQLKKRGHQIMDCDALFSEIDLTGIAAPAPVERLIWMLDLYLFAMDSAKDTKNLKIKSLDIVVTEKCTLKCADCSNLMQYYEKPQDSVLDVTLASLDRFMAQIDDIHEFRLIGGEPLMYKKLPEVIKHLSKYENCRHITIFTNGTINPKGEMLEAVKNKRVQLIISDYGSLSKNVKPLVESMKAEGVPIIVYNQDSWQDCAEIKQIERTPEQLEEVFGNCCVNDTMNLLHGKLYTCPFSAHTDNLKAVPHKAEDFVDLMNSDSAGLKERIRTLASGRKFISACNFCAGRDYNSGTVEVALQTKTVLPYTKYALESDAAPTK